LFEKDLKGEPTADGGGNKKASHLRPNIFSGTATGR
jgi:hypothetical protein